MDSVLTVVDNRKDSVLTVVDNRKDSVLTGVDNRKDSVLTVVDNKMDWVPTIVVENIIPDIENQLEVIRISGRKSRTFNIVQIISNIKKFNLV